MVEDTNIQWIAETQGERIDKLLVVRVPERSRSALQKMIEDGLVTANGLPVKSNYRTRVGDAIHARIPPEELPAEPQAEAIPLNVVYEDEYLLVIDKPAGMVVHPAVGHQVGTLVNALLSRLPDIADEDQPDRPGIVHRLDMETSGLIMVAKTAEVRATLQAQFKGREVHKTYLALVEGQVAASHGVINAALGRDPRQRKRISVTKDGREAVTEYNVLERFEHASYLEVQPQTGRTHQIRVHLAYIGYPIVGDSVYGFRKQRIKLNRHFLHAARLSFQHPVTGYPLELSAPLPAELQAVLDELRQEPR
jgi:23S rRNA pseudouridine1911/1915/1917 synthase